MLKNYPKYTMKGYIAILAVLVLLTVTGGIATTLLLTSIGEVQSVEALRQGEQALLFSESCLEEGLLRIIRDPDYSGENFEIPQGACEVTVEKNEEEYIIQAAGKNAPFERRVIAEAVFGAEELQVVNWKEE